MKIDLDVVAIIIGILGIVSSFTTMRVTLKFLTKSVEEIKKDFKGMGQKLNNQNNEVIYLKGRLDERYRNSKAGV